METRVPCDIKDLVTRVVERVDSLAEEIRATSLHLYRNPEISGEERDSARLLAGRAATQGFSVDLGLAGLPTAFRAVRNTPVRKPCIGFLAEYDALPGIGHGCGHNMIGTASTYAAIALAEVAEEAGGDVALFGTPAEETAGGKITMLEAGIFDDLAAALMAHPGTHTEVTYASLSCSTLIIEFFGQTAHAAAAPWRGINALDAMIQFFVGCDMLRKHLSPTSRLAGVIIKGGEVANMVPDYTMAEMSIRGKDLDEAAHVCSRVAKCAEGAAATIGARAECRKDGHDYAEMRPNQILADLYRDTWKELGGDEPSKEPRPHGSLDIANLSHRFPCLHPSFRIVQDESTPGHSRKFAEATVTTFAVDQLLRVTKALAVTGLKYITTLVSPQPGP